MLKANKPRLVGRRPVSSDMKKLECLFAEAAKASNTPDGIQARQVPTQSSRMKYSLKNNNISHFKNDRIDRYDQRSYTNYGWVVVNNILSNAEYSSFNEQFGEAYNQGKWYPKSFDGEYMFWVNDYGQRSNKVVFASGTPSNPIISKIVEIDRNVVDNIADYVEELRSFAEYGIDYRFISEDISGQKIYRSYEVQNLPNYTELQRIQ